MIKAIPNMLTVGNLFLGIVAIMLAFQPDYKYVDYAAIMVIIGMLLDGLDGRMARLLNAQSEFGKELDSLSDVITFGVAPAFIMYVAAFQEMGMMAMFIVAVFPICGALRLARFNVQTGGNTGYFVGLPITAAGGVLATLALYHNLFSPVYLSLAMLLLSYLMISKIKYPNFKKVGIPKSTYWVAPILIVVVAVLGFMYPTQFPKIVSIPLFLYALYGVKKGLDHFRKKWKKTKVDDDDKVYHDSSL
ncbi:CDP-diacylglycerol--serine O-phosphatidyltransferase [Ammoniphilus sp. CFH 90114]|uniref:CDP-diacylglycerol--serine O-phosphatidyltransferase n=1 Tax=Ammoniphilus sp. CFH 90114 TaxID=2493665 RepID=UPI00100FFBF5|nr:CDP-diacylglycerol--serine O-phosphatidyltransferase [Ammoniphilus sp. CFH 90114]RXT09049.1 CDP-diacylglycerol--serine O-phosphatidyltransferase [Ammoniphilus sp. CFH 90114]